MGSKFDVPACEQKLADWQSVIARLLARLEVLDGRLVDPRYSTGRGRQLLGCGRSCARVPPQGHGLSRYL